MSWSSWSLSIRTHTVLRLWSGLMHTGINTGHPLPIDHTVTALSTAREHALLQWSGCVFNGRSLKIIPFKMCWCLVPCISLDWFEIMQCFTYRQPVCSSPGGHLHQGIDVLCLQVHSLTCTQRSGTSLHPLCSALPILFNSFFFQDVFHCCLILILSGLIWTIYIADKFHLIWTPQPLWSAGGKWKWSCSVMSDSLQPHGL